MQLLPADKKYLDDKGYVYEVHETRNNETLLIIKDYTISPMYDCSMVDVLIRIPKGYPIVRLDMFWVYPIIRLKDTKSLPPQADVFNDFLEIKWQRFSRHYNWQPSFGLANHLKVVKNVLVDGRG